MKIKSFSPSRGQTFERCTFKYYLAYERELQDQLYTSKFAAGFGSAVHETLECYAKNQGLELEIWRKVLAGKLRQHKTFLDMHLASKKVQPQYFIDRECHTCPFFNEATSVCGLYHKKHIDEFEGCPLKLFNQAANMVQAAIDRYGKYFHSGIKNDENPDGKMLSIEKEFHIQIGEDNWGDPIIIHGFMDLVVELDDETVEVIDYKTGFKTQKTDELMKDLQARVYSVAIRQEYPEYKYHMLTFDYFRGQAITPPLESHHSDGIIKDVISRWNRIKGQTSLSRLKPTNFVCKYLCNRELCDHEWEKLRGMQV